MRLASVALTLLAAGAACSGSPPLDSWELLNDYRRRLQHQEAAVYRPAEFARFEARIEGLAAELASKPALDAAGRRPLLDGEIGRLIDAAADLEASLTLAKEELQQRQDEVAANIVQRLRRADDYRHFPELQPAVARLRATLASLRPFEEAGAYRDNLDLLEQARTQAEQLQLRWVRFAAVDAPTPELDAELQAFEVALAELTPSEPYIVIDTALNRLTLKDGDQTLLEAVCSIGSGHQMVADGRHWEFDTPRGEFTIRRKIREPSWRKPDWAFLEVGEPVPKQEEDRIEHGSLGAFAFEFADGYFIHGTLYKRLLGQPVTHGCIRLQDTDLLEMAAVVNKGSKVWIF